MKKYIILAILAIYILSIAVVGFFGMKTAVYNEIKYVTEIQLIDSKDGDYTVIYDEEDNRDNIALSYTDGLRFQLYYEVTPLDATNTAVTFDFELDEYSDYIQISSTGVVTVLPGDYEYITVYGKIRAQDGSRASSRTICIFIMKW
ncbi:MAG: hypothetical protein E7350_04725 [Clostridiales bacterium]|nr:hypothetical protein [Clostridiales bacterium]